MIPASCRLLNTVVVYRVGLVVHAAELAERQVDDVGVQDDHVVERGQQRGVGNVALHAARDLRDDYLRLWCDADDLVRITGSDASDVRAMRAVVAWTRHRVIVIVRIVVGEGELLVVVDTGLTHAQLGGQGLDIGGCHRGRSREGAGEGRVSHFHARVDDGDDCAFTLLGELVGVHHELGAQVVRVLTGHARGRGCALRVDANGIGDWRVTFNEGGLDAACAADRVQGAGGCLQGEAVKSLVVLTFHTRGGFRATSRPRPR